MAMATATLGPLLGLAVVVVVAAAAAAVVVAAAATAVVVAGALVVLDLQASDQRVGSVLVSAGTASRVVVQLVCSLDGKDFAFWELNTF